jgi:hypothetical protein
MSAQLEQAAEPNWSSRLLAPQPRTILRSLDGSTLAPYAGWVGSIPAGSADLLLPGRGGGDHLFDRLEERRQVIRLPQESCDGAVFDRIELRLMS